MRALVTGGAGFIGRWVVAELLSRSADVLVLDNLSSGCEANLAEFAGRSGFREFVVGDIRDRRLAGALLGRGVDLVLHLAAKINVQDSIDRPAETFDADVAGTFGLLELCRERRTPFLFMSTCMVYARALDRAIDEKHPTFPASPYAAAKLSGEALTLSYGQAYGLPVVVVRPFNTYGPFQRADGEGGVVSIFCQRELAGRTLDIYGSGRQTRDLLYATDCARFVVEAAAGDRVRGRVLNAGSGRDVTVNELAAMICPDAERIRHVEHIHPQSEIMKLQCDYRLARELLGWEPQVRLEEGVERVREWLRHQTR
ncbi:MAG TPA: GDP-mannose 4,6-dehydratase [Planctomycetota bacterium]|nr:GDP-mannose 4,6-dehydratase [Planctomycetota bacterium]